MNYSSLLSLTGRDSEPEESHMSWSSSHFLRCTGSHLPCLGHLQACKLLQGTGTGIPAPFNVLSPSSQPCPGRPPERGSLTGSETLSPSKLFLWSVHAWIQPHTGQGIMFPGGCFHLPSILHPQAMAQLSPAGEGPSSRPARPPIFQASI